MAGDLSLALPRAGSLDQFIRTASLAPYLSEQEEHDLAVRLHEQGDLEAARTLVLSHLRYVIYVARGYSGYGLPQADLIQEGSIGLMKAVRRFDPYRGVRLVSFAAHWIRAEIHEYVLRNWSIVKVATTKAQRKLFFNLRQYKDKLTWLSDSDARAVAEELGVKPSDVLEMDARLSERAVAFDPTDDDEEGGLAPAQSLSTPDDQPEVLFESEDWDRHRHEQLGQALGALDARSRDIIESRWLAEDKLGLKELGERHGVSAERIRQIEQQAMRKLQHQLAPA